MVTPSQPTTIAWIGDCERFVLNADWTYSPEHPTSFPPYRYTFEQLNALGIIALTPTNE